MGNKGLIRGIKYTAQFAQGDIEAHIPIPIPGTE